LIQSVPTNSQTKIIQLVKSITAKERFKKHAEVKKQLSSGEVWGKGFYVNFVGKHGNENTIKVYVQSQGREPEYKKLHSQQLRFLLIHRSSAAGTLY
jgi:putative transposase